MKDDLELQTVYPNHTFYNEVEYLFSPIFKHYSRYEWLRDQTTGRTTKQFMNLFISLQYRQGSVFYYRV